MVLRIAIIFITAALAFYSVGVWAERLGGRLRWWHAIVFWLGLICDSIGTGAMGAIAGGMFKSTFHGITGMTAIILMLFHATWATIVLLRKNETMIRKFHRFSIFVWLVWLVPMIGGMLLGATV